MDGIYDWWTPCVEAAITQQSTTFTAAASAAGNDADGNDDILSSRMYDLLLFRSRAELQGYRRSFALAHLPEGHINADPCGIGGIRCELLFGLSEHLVREGSSKGRLLTRVMTSGDTEHKTWYEDPDERPLSTPKEDKERRLGAWPRCRLGGGRSAPWQSSASGSMPISALAPVVAVWCRMAAIKRGLPPAAHRRHPRAVAGPRPGRSGGDSCLRVPPPCGARGSGAHRITSCCSLHRVKAAFFMHGAGNIEGGLCDLPSVLSAMFDKNQQGEQNTACASHDDTTLWPLIAAASVNATIHMGSQRPLFGLCQAG